MYENNVNGIAEDYLRYLRQTGASAFVLLCLLAFVGPDPAGAAEVAILKSADLAAYNQAVAGFKATMPPSTTFVEYDMQGDVARGQKLARKIRDSDATLLLAVGVKARRTIQEILRAPQRRLHQHLTSSLRIQPLHLGI